MRPSGWVLYSFVMNNVLVLNSFCIFILSFNKYDLGFGK